MLPKEFMKQLDVYNRNDSPLTAVEITEDLIATVDHKSLFVRRRNDFDRVVATFYGTSQIKLWMSLEQWMQRTGLPSL